MIGVVNLLMRARVWKTREFWGKGEQNSDSGQQAFQEGPSWFWEKHGISTGPSLSASVLQVAEIVAK